MFVTGQLIIIIKLETRTVAFEASSMIAILILNISAYPVQ